MSSSFVSFYFTFTKFPWFFFISFITTTATTNYFVSQWSSSSYLIIIHNEMYVRFIYVCVCSVFVCASDIHINLYWKQRTKGKWKHFGNKQEKNLVNFCFFLLSHKWFVCVSVYVYGVYIVCVELGSDDDDEIEFNQEWNAILKKD